MFKKTISFVLTLCILTVFSIPCFANTTEANSATLTKPIDVQLNTIDPLKVQEALNTLVDNNSITQDYADKVIAIVNKYTYNSIDSSEKDLIKADYYNPKTGAIIMSLPLPSPANGQLMFNKAGWDIIKEVINLGGGATTIGLGIAALCGIAITGPVAAIIGGIVVVANAAVNLQFALGNEFAYLPY